MDYRIDKPDVFDSRSLDDLLNNYVNVIKEENFNNKYAQLPKFKKQCRHGDRVKKWQEKQLKQ